MHSEVAHNRVKYKRGDWMPIIRWNRFKEIDAGTPSREGGVSKAPYHSLNLAFHVGDNYDHVKENRQRFLSMIGLPENRLVVCRQSHCDAIKKVTLADGGKGSASFETGVPDADALYTKDKRLALGVFHADCVPVLFYVPNAKIVGAIHAGWQGTLKEITYKALRHVMANEGVKPEDIFVYLGPAITREDLEIQDDVIQLAKKLPYGEQGLVKRNGQTYLDVYALNLLQLAALGIPKTQIDVTPYSSVKDAHLFFSYRRDHQISGRHISYIYLK